VTDCFCIIKQDAIENSW